MFLNIFFERNYPFNTLNAELNPVCHLLALLGAHHILHVSGLRVSCRLEYKNMVLREIFGGKMEKLSVRWRTFE